MICNILKYIFAIALLLVVPQAAQAVTLTQQRLDQISRNCTGAQINLKQLQKRDAVSRINRGRAYDQQLRQVNALNSRFAYNKISVPQFVQMTAQLQRSIDSFRSLYSSYDEQLTNAIAIDCKKETSKFYDYIEKARQQRDAIAADIETITKLSHDYRTEVVNYQTTLSDTDGGAQ